jgi:O-acetyl-ADP-ribose deacetylase (regulator of RNase III)
MVENFGLFLENVDLMNSGRYIVKSNVTLDVFAEFLNRVQGDSFTITKDNYISLRLLSAEFGFPSLEAELDEFERQNPEAGSSAPRVGELFYDSACRKYLGAPFDSEEDEISFKLDFQSYVNSFPDKPGIDLFALSGRNIEVGGTRITLWKGDITQLKVDAIVNAANESLLGGGGVDFAIHNAAGPALVRECATLGGCDVGEAKITKGYRLPSKSVIHTVGPLLDHQGNTKPDELAKCYRACLALCAQNSLTSIAFCCISCGFYGFPNSQAAEVAVNAVKQYITERQTTPIQNVVFCVFDDEQFAAYNDIMCETR